MITNQYASRSGESILSLSDADFTISAEMLSLSNSDREIGICPTCGVSFLSGSGRKKVRLCIGLSVEIVSSYWELDEKARR